MNPHLRRLLQKTVKKIEEIVMKKAGRNYQKEFFSLARAFLFFPRSLELPEFLELPEITLPKFLRLLWVSIP